MSSTYSIRTNKTGRRNGSNVYNVYVYMCIDLVCGGQVWTIGALRTFTKHLERCGDQFVLF